MNGAAVVDPGTLAALRLKPGDEARVWIENAV
jgi:hypothetical protein